MASISEYEQQQFWSDKPNLPKGWITEYISGYDINITYNKEFLQKLCKNEKQNTMSFKGTILNFNNEK